MSSGYFSPRPLGGEGAGSEAVMSVNSAILNSAAIGLQALFVVAGLLDFVPHRQDIFEFGGGMNLGG